MIFYATALSSYSAKTRIVLVAKGVRFEEREPPGGYRSAEYRALVPMGTVPAIVDGGLALSESEVIHEYLEERFPRPSLLPGEAHDRARIRFLARFHDLYLEPPVRRLFPHMRADAGDPETVAALATEIDARLAQLASLVRPRPFLASEVMTLADCGFAVTIPLACRLLAALGRPPTLPAAIAGWLPQVAAHPAVATALSAWGPATDHWIRSRRGA
jgi:glutathione S-transferase